MNKKIESKVEAKLISKIANHRLMVRELFRKRHKDVFDGLIASQCMYHINELRVWLRMAELIDKGKYCAISIGRIEPYETYYAKQLTK
jgi:hypothetical protein